ncbi:hypothetical protein LP420_15400 [Massilia sp. B-10]|nr:hypothetical protein LP420_15400 [Massilia sp. B-10]
MKITGAAYPVLRHVHIEALRLVAAVGHVAHQAHAGRHVLARRTGVAVVERGVIGGPGGAARFDPVAQGRAASLGGNGKQQGNRQQTAGRFHHGSRSG